MSESDYGWASRLLHRLALGMPGVGQLSFDLEHALNRYEEIEESTPPVFICGLARAGTTILMRTLHDSGAFRSLTYRDMPFVLMPGVWRRMSRPFHSHKAQAERAHGDRIRIGFDSPEAFEEIFWRTFCGRQYIRERALVPHEPDNEQIRQFRKFVTAVVASSHPEVRRRYLSKNNNNLLRLNAIRRAFPEAHIVIPYRDPIQQATSLCSQHKRFVDIQGGDRFALSYMNWLGHHEFGCGHRPFLLHGQSDATGHPDQPDYWLRCWIDAYAFMVENMPAGAVLTSYERLCANPEKILAAIGRHVGCALQADAGGDIQAAAKKDWAGIDSALRADAYALYERLDELAVG